MAKRVLGESGSVNIELVIQSDSPAKKKSRKEKNDPELKEYQRLGKVVNGEERETKEQRKERKQLKKARKPETGGKFNNESPVQPLDLGDADVKHTRKAEKAKQSAAEQGQEQLSQHPADDKLPPLALYPEASVPNGFGAFLH